MTAIPTRDAQAQSFIPARILVVDDHVELQACVARLLTTRGHVVSGATSGEAAVQRIAENPDAFDLLVTDLCMSPGMWGDELAHHAREYSPTLGLVVMTSEPGRLVGRAYLRWHDVEVLCKPFRVDDLYTAVQSVLVWKTVTLPG